MNKATNWFILFNVLVAYSPIKGSNLHTDKRNKTNSFENDGESGKFGLRISPLNDISSSTAHELAFSRIKKLSDKSPKTKGRRDNLPKPLGNDAKYGQSGFFGYESNNRGNMGSQETDEFSRNLPNNSEKPLIPKDRSKAPKMDKFIDLVDSAESKNLENYLKTEENQPSITIEEKRKNKTFLIDLVDDKEPPKENSSLRPNTAAKEVSKYSFKHSPKNSYQISPNQKNLNTFGFKEKPSNSSIFFSDDNIKEPQNGLLGTSSTEEEKKEENKKEITAHSPKSNVNISSEFVEIVNRIDLVQDHSEEDNRSFEDNLEYFPKSKPIECPIVEISFPSSKTKRYLPSWLFDLKGEPERFRKEFQILLKYLKEDCFLHYSFRLKKELMFTQVQFMSNLLDDQSCIGEEIINPYMKLLWLQSKNQHLFKVVDSVWYTRDTLTENFEFKQGLTYLVPVHNAFHWTLLVIKYIGTKEVELDYYDSLNPNCSSNTRLENPKKGQNKLLNMAGLLKIQEFASKHGLEINLNDIEEFKSPQQSNGIDCGLYTLFNLEQVLNLRIPSNVEKFDVVQFRIRIALDLIQGKISQFHHYSYRTNTLN